MKKYIVFEQNHQNFKVQNWAHTKIQVFKDIYRVLCINYVFAMFLYIFLKLKSGQPHVNYLLFNTLYFSKIKLKSYFWNSY